MVALWRLLALLIGMGGLLSPLMTGGKLTTSIETSALSRVGVTFSSLLHNLSGPKGVRAFSFPMPDAMLVVFRKNALVSGVYVQEYTG
jgi:hypothetical protein